jgi:hypothetical protein
MRRSLRPRNPSCWLVVGLGAVWGACAQQPSALRHDPPAAPRLVSKPLATGSRPAGAPTDCAATQLRLLSHSRVRKADGIGPRVTMDADGLVWLTDFDLDADRSRVLAYDVQGRMIRASPPARFRGVAEGLTAAPQGLAVFGWSQKEKTGFVEWFGYDGSPGASWTYPGNVGVVRLGAHRDGSVTLLLHAWGETVVHGRALKGPPVEEQSAHPLVVAVRVAADGRLRWLEPIRQDRSSGTLGLLTAPDGRAGTWRPLAPHGVHTDGLELWDATGREVWRSSLRSVTAATFDSSGALVVLGGVAATNQPGPIVHSVAPPDSPQVLEHWGSVPRRRELCREACVGEAQLAASRSGGVFLLGAFNGTTLLGWKFRPQKPPLAVNWVLAAFDGSRPRACASLTTTHAQLAMGGAGPVAVLTENVYGPALVNGRLVGDKGDVSLLRFVLDDATSDHQ